jgi:hypothetical protein
VEQLRRQAIPELDTSPIGAAVVMPFADTFAMQIHLDEISRYVREGSVAVLLLDKAGVSPRSADAAGRGSVNLSECWYKGRISSSEGSCAAAREQNSLPCTRDG